MKYFTNDTLDEEISKMVSFLIYIILTDESLYYMLTEK